MTSFNKGISQKMIMIIKKASEKALANHKDLPISQQIIYHHSRRCRDFLLVEFREGIKLQPMNTVGSTVGDFLFGRDIYALILYILLGLFPFQATVSRNSRLLFLSQAMRGSHLPTTLYLCTHRSLSLLPLAGEFLSVFP